MPVLDRREVMAAAVFDRIVDQYEWVVGLGGGGRLCVPLERLQIACDALEFEMNEPLLDLVQATTRWYEQLNRPKSKESEEGENAAWVN